MAAYDVLITGVSGMLGANLALDWRGRRRVAGTCRSRPPHLPGVTLAALDLAGESDVAGLMARLSPAVVVHCAADTDVDACQGHPEDTRRVNALATAEIALACRDIGARLVYISTDAVFAGDRGGYAEDDEPGPVNAYAASKLEGERLALAGCPDCLVLRTNIFGPGRRDNHGLAEWILSQGRKNVPFLGFTDVFFAPVLTSVLGEIVEAALAVGLTGIWHVAAPVPISKYAFARRLLAAFGLDPGLVRPGSLEDVRFAAPRPRNSALDGTRLAARLPGTIDLDLDAGIARMVRLDAAGRSHALRQVAQMRPTVTEAFS